MLVQLILELLIVQIVMMEHFSTGRYERLFPFPFCAIFLNHCLSCFVRYHRRSSMLSCYRRHYLVISFVIIGSVGLTRFVGRIFLMFTSHSVFLVVGMVFIRSVTTNGRILFRLILRLCVQAYSELLSRGRIIAYIIFLFYFVVAHIPDDQISQR